MFSVECFPRGVIKEINIIRDKVCVFSYIEGNGYKLLHYVIINMLPSDDRLLSNI